MSQQCKYKQSKSLTTRNLMEGSPNQAFLEDIELRETKEQGTNS